MSPKPGKTRRRAAGPPYGSFVPLLLPEVAPLSGNEFKLAADAVMRRVEEAAGLPGFPDHTFRESLNFALDTYVNARLVVKSLPSQGEIAHELEHKAARMAEAGKMIAEASEIVMEPPPEPLFVDGVTTARAEAYVMTAPALLREREQFFLCIRGAVESMSRMAALAEKQSLKLKENATRHGPHERVATKSFIATLRVILKAAGVSVEIGTGADAGIAYEKRPLVRLARLMLKLALDRIGEDQNSARKEVESSANLGQIAFFRLVSSSKVNRGLIVF
jgi:hypothetical protein